LMKYCLSLFAFALLIISCTDQPITTHYENGQVYEVYQYKGDSLKHGTYERFSESGILLEKSIYKDGYVDGLRSIYNTDGNLEITETYADKKLNGTYSTYYPDGTLQLSAEYANDVMQGIVKGYYASGAIKEETRWTQGGNSGETRWKQ